MGFDKGPKFQLQDKSNDILFSLLSVNPMEKGKNKSDLTNLQEFKLSEALLSG